MHTLLLAVARASEPAADATIATPSWREHLQVDGYAETYLALDSGTGTADAHRRPPFLYSHARTGGVTVNLALLRAALDTERVRGAAALMAGTFTEDNQGFEEPGLQNVYEARVGVRLAGRTWVDAGVFPSHLGAESAIGVGNPTLTRSLTAENSPYYLAGAKLGTAVGESLQLGVVAANGWQSIRQTTPLGVGGGTWVTWSPSSSLTVDWSTWAGLQQPSGELRLFNDLYAVVSLERVDLIAWADVGAQGGRVWGGGNLQGRVWANDALGFSGRVEAYADPDGVIVAVDDAGITLVGGSAGVDVRVRPVPASPDTIAMWRTELRLLRADREVFPEGTLDPCVTTSLALGF